VSARGSTPASDFSGPGDLRTAPDAALRSPTDALQPDSTPVAAYLQLGLRTERGLDPDEDQRDLERASLARRWLQRIQIIDSDEGAKHGDQSEEKRNVDADPKTINMKELWEKGLLEKEKFRASGQAPAARCGAVAVSAKVRKLKKKSRQKMMTKSLAST